MTLEDNPQSITIAEDKPNPPTFVDELEMCLRARFTLLILVTREEERVLDAARSVCERSRSLCLAWDIADGFEVLAGGGGPALVARDPLQALEQIQNADGPVLFVLKDFHEAWGVPQVKRKLRNVAQRLKYTRKS